jgi:formylmethanofuran dehydrogenase subunit E-like metal-binding protein
MEEEKKESNILEALKELYFLICLSNVDEIVKEGSEAYYDKNLAPIADQDDFDEQLKAALKKLFIIIAAQVIEKVPINKKDG